MRAARPPGSGCGPHRPARRGPAASRPAGSRRPPGRRGRSSVGIPAAAGSDRSARPASQSPFSRTIARAAATSSWIRASALARTSACRPGRVPCGQVGDRRGEVRTGHLGRVVRHPGDDRQRDGRRIEQDQRGRPDPDAGQGGGGHRAPAVADDLELRDVEARRPDPRGDVGGVVAEAVVTRPVPGQAVPGQVRCHDASAGRGERRPDPPPDAR